MSKTIILTMPESINGWQRIQRGTLPINQNHNLQIEIQSENPCIVFEAVADTPQEVMEIFITKKNLSLPEKFKKSRLIGEFSGHEVFPSYPHKGMTFQVFVAYP